MTIDQPKKHLRDVDKAVIQAVMFEQGIVPMTSTDLDMRRPLSQLPPDEARRLRRKFRKLWRLAMNDRLKELKRPAQETNLKALLGQGKRVPSRAERTLRKKIVFDKLWNANIAPLIKAFESHVGGVTKTSA